MQKFRNLVYLKFGLSADFDEVATNSSSLSSDVDDEKWLSEDISDPLSANISQAMHL